MVSSYKMNNVPAQERGGVKEGVARSLSQSIVYGLETRKTRSQLRLLSAAPMSASAAPMSASLTLPRLATGMATSSLTAGFVFFTYYSIYNHLVYAGNPFASGIASFVTSFIKLPIGNSMRLMQSGVATNVFSSGRQLFKQKGLYKGYTVCLLEDTIEMDVKTRLYRHMTHGNKKHKKGYEATAFSAMHGALAGAVSSGLTNPFDTVRAHMCITPGRGPLQTARHLWQHAGPNAFVRGVHMRMASNAIKSAAFFAIFEFMSLSISISS